VLDHTYRVTKILPNCLTYFILAVYVIILQKRYQYQMIIQC